VKIHRRRARWLVLALLAGLTILIPIANATPPDPSWIRGLYDDDDFDNVALVVTSSVGTVGSFVLDDACFVAPLIAGLLLPSTERSTSETLAALRPRAPPTV
jgi:hypothetical protein